MESIENILSSKSANSNIDGDDDVSTLDICKISKPKKGIDVIKNVAPYSHLQDKLWPKIGRHILACYNDSSIVVYQAFCEEIANFAVKNQCFGGSKYSHTRMTWIKPNFLWMMYRSGWASKPGQRRILAITMKREAFENIILNSWPSSYGSLARTIYKTKEEWEDAKEKKDCVIQWDPDHDLDGKSLERRAIQLGVKGKTAKSSFSATNGSIERIQDITDFVISLRNMLANRESLDLNDFLIPAETVYNPLPDGDPLIKIHAFGIGSSEEKKV